MKPLADLYLALDQTNKTGEKVGILAEFFRTAPDDEKLWALALLSGRRPRRQVHLTRLRAWAAEEAGIPAWLFDECHEQTGDLAETIALLLPPPRGQNSRSTGDWIAQLSVLKNAGEREQRQVLTEAWETLTAPERLVFNKLITGAFRIGVSQTLVTRALSEATGLDKHLLAHRLTGAWSPHETSFAEIVSPSSPRERASQPYPFCLAHALDRPPADLGPVSDWLLEWKWDGIRGQVIHRENLLIWSRGEEMVAERFPELGQLIGCVLKGTVLDGEILPYRDRPLGFSVLQTRLGRKAVTAKLLREAPVAFVAYDLLEWQGRDIRQKPLRERRELLTRAFANQPCRPGAPLLLVSESLAAENWRQVAELRERARDQFAEGLMIKRLDAPYAVGRPKGIWWKWKVDPLSVDAVLVYAQPGHGRRSGLFTDYTFAVWKHGELTPFAKPYSGLSDREIRQVDAFVKANTLEKKGPVRIVEPKLVFEIGFENVLPSSRHRAGWAVRFPRILRWRRDKTVEQADTVETLSALYHAPDKTQTLHFQQLELFDKETLEPLPKQSRPVAGGGDSPYLES